MVKKYCFAMPSFTFSITILAPGSYVSHPWARWAERTILSLIFKKVTVLEARTTHHKCIHHMLVIRSLRWKRCDAFLFLKHFSQASFKPLNQIFTPCQEEFKPVRFWANLCNYYRDMLENLSSQLLQPRSGYTEDKLTLQWIDVDYPDAVINCA